MAADLCAALGRALPPDDPPAVLNAAISLTPAADHAPKKRLGTGRLSSFAIGSLLGAALGYFVGAQL